MSCMSQNFRLFHVSNLSVRNFRIFLLMYTGSLILLGSALEIGDRHVGGDENRWLVETRIASPVETEAASVR